MRDRGVLALCAVRYALGRKSYMPNAVAEEVRAVLKEDGIPPNDRQVMTSDIRKFLEEHPNDVNATLWRDLAETLHLPPPSSDDLHVIS